MKLQLMTVLSGKEVPKAILEDEWLALLDWGPFCVEFAVISTC